MKKLLYTLLISAGVFSQTSAQSIYLDDEFLSAVGNASELIEVANHITNNSGVTVDFRWERIQYDIPTGWDVPFCDKNNCYASFITTADFTLTDGETGMLKPVFTPNNVEGIGVMAVRVYSITPGVTFEDTASFQATTEGMTGINDVAQSFSVEIFPTLSSNTLNISAASAKPTLYSIISQDGRNVTMLKPLAWQADVEEISVASLPSGHYFLLLYSNENSVVVSKPFIKL